LFNEAEERDADTACAEDDTTITVASHRRQRKPRVSIPAAYPREVIHYELPKAERVCPHDGTPLKSTGTDDHEQLDIIPAVIRVLLHRRQKYLCPCCEQYQVTASKPKQPIEKSIASPGLLAYIATQKYCDALPLYRQAGIFQRLSIELSRTNLANWMVRCGELLQPLVNLLLERILEQPVVHLDETTVQVLNEPGKTAQSKSQMWVVASRGSQPGAVFHYAPTRSQQVPLTLLHTDVSSIMVDGYEGYQAACDQYGITRLGCWAHARRKLVEAKHCQPKGKTGKADQGLAFVQKLYAIETAIKDKPPDQRLAIRQQQSQPVIDKLRMWLDKSLLQVPPKTTLGKALYYLQSQWDRLVAYVDDGAAPIDNNFAENCIRPFAVGRKNWLFANSQAGATASANLYSLVQTAKLNELNPYAYLKHVFKELPNAQTIEAIEALLPWEVTLPQQPA